MIRLTHETVDHNDIDSLIDWLKTYPRLTKGDLTLEFEKRFAETVGSQYALLVNSGSSANLLAAAVLQQHNFDKVVVPAICWSTDLAPIIQLGMHPIVVDCDPFTLSVDVNELESVFVEHKPDALFLVSVLGIQPNMNAITALCKKHKVFLIEDTCESFGSTYNGQPLGTFGDIGTFSFYFSHHMSTIEGGMVVTDNEMLYMLMTMMRAHGWDRDLPQEHRDYLHEKYNLSEFDAKFAFYVTGFNMRATEIQAKIGLSQLDKSQSMIFTRSRLTQRYKDNLSSRGKWTPTILNEGGGGCPPDGPMSSLDVCSGFGWPVITQHRGRLVERLAKEEIECRPLVAGSICRHPIMENNRFIKVPTPVANTIHENGMYVPIHCGMTDSDVDMVCEIILEET